MFVIPQSKWKQISEARTNYLQHVFPWAESGIRNVLKKIYDENTNTVLKQPVEFYRPVYFLLKRFLNEGSSWNYKKIIGMPYDRMEEFWCEEFVTAPELQQISSFFGTDILISEPGPGIKIMAPMNSFNKTSQDKQETNISCDGNTYTREKLYKDLFNSLSKCFPYEKLVEKKSNSKEYDSYSLCSDLGINVCIYCNANYTWTIEEAGKKGSQEKIKLVRPELDHYLPKSQFPIFRLSFENLIPSCSMCNGKIKHDGIMLPSTHLHPYQKTTPKLGFYFDDKGKILLLPDDDEKLLATMEFMRTNTVYGYYGQELKDLWEKYSIYTPEYMKDIMALFDKENSGKLKRRSSESLIEMSLNSENFLKHLFGYVEEDDAGKVSLGEAKHFIVAEILKQWDEENK